MTVCSKRGLLAGPGRGCWLVDHVVGALGAWRVAGMASWVSTGTAGVAEDEERVRAGVLRATALKSARRIGNMYIEPNYIRFGLVPNARA